MSDVWITIALAGVGTFLLRASFLLVAHRLVDMPRRVTRVLEQIPPAAFAALILPALLRPEGELDLWQPTLAVGIAAAYVSWRTRNVALTLAFGMVTLTALQQVV